jgi:hypothetical protein
MRCGPLLLALAATVLAAPLTVHAQQVAAAPKGADIRWPTPSQPPGTVTYRSKYPTEAAWDSALARFAEERGNAFQAMADAARHYADGSGEAPRAALLSAAVHGVSPPSTLPLLRAVDIVRLPVLPVEEMAPHLALVRRQLEALKSEGLTRAVWEITDLPKADALAAWADACFTAFPQPPILMLGWHLDNGHISPAHDPALRFIEACAPRCHSVMITGEELNTQFYGIADGGQALPFLRYWIGALRSRAPGALLWCRIDEMTTSQRPNARQEAWTRELLPLCDGLVYQVNHGGRDVSEGRRVSEQFQAVERVVADQRRAGTHPPRRAKDSSWPVLLGGFVVMRAAPPGHPGFGVAGMAAELGAYEAWLGKGGVAGYIRYVGMLPGSPAAELVAGSLPGPAAARVEKDAAAAAPAAGDGGQGEAPAGGSPKP